MTVLVNGVAAENSFAGIPYYLAGVTQVNFIVPPGTPTGNQPVTVTLAGNGLLGFFGENFFPVPYAGGLA